MTIDKSNRQEIKRRIAKAKIWHENREQRRQVIADLQRKIEFELPQQHESKTRPLQDELRVLEDDEIERLVAGEPPNAEADAKRRQVRNKIDDANRELEQAVQTELKLKQRLEREIDQTAAEARDHSLDALQSQLAAAGDPEILAEHQAANKVLRRVVAMCQQLAKEVYEIQSLLDFAKTKNKPDQSTVREYSRQLAAKEREADVAETLQHMLATKCNQLQQQLLE